MAVAASLSATPGREIERYGNGRKLALVIDRERSCRRRVMRDGAERNFLTHRRADIDVIQRCGILPELRRDLHHHVILIQRRVHGGDLRLPERFVQSVVNHLRRDAQARRGIAIVNQRSLQSAVLLIGVDVGENAQLAHFGEQTRAPSHQIVNVVALNRVLILRVALAAADAQVLPRLQEDRRAGQWKSAWDEGDRSPGWS